MRFINWMPALFMCVLVSSCIKSEPLNAECDIIEASLPGDVLNREPIIENSKVTFIVKNNTPVTALAPTFEITPGATIEPMSGTVRNFLTPKTYTVTSQDGQWQKEYTVSVEVNNSINLEYNFEHVRQRSSATYDYDIFYEVGPSGNEIMTWASGNAGFALTGQGGVPSSFPTYQLADGRTGKCAALTTRLTGPWGAGMKMPLAAGNLFIGTFIVNLTNPLKSTRFGTPFVNIPRNLRGHFKYAPGETYMKLDDNNKLQEMPGVVDKFNIYAVFFEAVDGMEYLDGTNVLSADNPNIVAVAEIADVDRVAASEWTEFDIPFEYRPGKTIDPQKLIDGRYSITIVFTSSIEGDYFSGAPGSTLLIDDVSLVCLSQSEI